MKTDAEIQRDVMEELKWEPFLIASEIGVAVHNGVVTLGGFVDTYAKKFAAEHAAWRVKGVKAIAEELQVLLTDDGKLPDAEIAENIVNALKWNNSLSEDKIKINVMDGWVTLSGEVDWKYEKDLAHNAIRYLKGVKGDNNEITVKPSVNKAVVKDHIYEALERNAHFEAETIKVETIGNTVVLKGTIRSWNERQAVERAAWSTPGVSSVQDDLVMAYN
jgi:osmotically-inducible protein OsmY